ncbi:MAG: hypothetical protein H7Y42_14115, partial [Chitinophagaceae bacterium]|nr:hypothetical protein [Chitinophagaceae bacterium]
MKKELYFFCLLILGITPYVGGQTPTLASSNMTFNSLEGNGFRTLWTAGNGARRIVIMRQGSAVTATPTNGVDYNSSGVFGSGDAVQPGQFVVFDGASTFVDVTNLQPSTTYHLAIFEYNGTASTTQYLTATFAFGSQATLSAPVTPPSAVVFSNIIGNSMTVGWTNGSGTRRLVLVRQGSAVNANPVDLTSYPSSSLFGGGAQIGTGNYAVYSSTSNSVTVTGLLPSTTYHVAVFEFNGTTGPVYHIPGATGSSTTLARPTIAASAPNFNSIEGNSMRLFWTPGNGTRRVVIARANSSVTAVPVDGVDYAASAVFGSGEAVQPGEFVVYDNNSTLVDITNLSSATTYHFRIFEYDGTGATTGYLTSSFATASQSTLSPPTTPASALNVTNLTGISATIGWTNGNGTRRLVLMRSGSAVNANPVDLTSYGGSSNFGSGTQIGAGNYVVFTGSSNTVGVTALQINTTYHFSVFEQNGIQGPLYLVPGASGSFTTPSQPTVASSSMAFNSIEGGSLRVTWTLGNGARRIIVARQGSAVTAVPVDGVDYTSSGTFGSGDAILAGQFVVGDNASSFVDVSGLQPATTYHFRVYEYNGTGVNTAYLTSTFASGSQATTTAPTIQSSGISFSNVSGSSARINWTNGNGASRIILVRQGGAVNANPVDLTSYSPNTNFGTGPQVGVGNYVIFRSSSGLTEVMTNLTPNTTYHIAMFEFNGASSPVYLVPGAVANFTTAAQPTIAATGMTFSIVDGNNLRINWTNGNGQRRIVVAREGSAVTAVPSNGTDYASSGTFGSGDAILPGQFVVADGATTFVDVSNLNANTVYHFAVFEYDGTASNIAYLTSSFLSGSQSTIGAPTIQASNLVFNSVTGTSATAAWTNGNGVARILVARQGSPVNADPVNFVLYSQSGSFGSGGQIGVGNYVI